MATGYKIQLANVPQGIKGGLKIHGAKDSKGKDLGVLRYHGLKEDEGRCTVEGSKKTVYLPASTPLITLANDEYQIDEEAQNNG